MRMIYTTRRGRLQESAGQLRDALRAARKGAEKADRTARELSQSEVGKKVIRQRTALLQIYAYLTLTFFVLL